MRHAHDTSREIGVLNEYGSAGRRYVLINKLQPVEQLLDRNEFHMLLVGHPAMSFRKKR
jgi:hypothetical protein